MFLEHCIAYKDFKDLIRRTGSDKILRDKANISKNLKFNISKNSKYDGYQFGLASKVCRFSDKK